MFTRKLAVLLASLCVAQAVGGAESPALGVPVDDATLQNIDFTILPNGDGLPPGSGTAREGAAVYLKYCQACHGDGGTGGVNDVLVGGQGSLNTAAPQKTIGSYWPYATTVFDYIRRAMPLPTPGVLSADEIYAVTAYILHLNDIIPEDQAMTAETLPRVEMPNRDGFVWAYSP